MRRRKPKHIFVYKCDYCNKEHENINCGSDYVVYASGKRFCREPDCWSLYMKQKEKEKEEQHVRYEEKRQRVYGKKIFNEEEKKERQKVIAKAEAYLKELKGKYNAI